jgi:hypothetical protein
MTGLKVIIQFVLILNTLFFTSCKHDAISEVSTEGKLIYKVTFYDEFHKIYRTDLKWEYNVLFNKEKVRVYTNYNDKRIEILNINKGLNQILSMSVLSDSIANFSTINDYVKLVSGTTYSDTTIIRTNEKKIIKGFECTKTIYKLGKNVSKTFWTTDKINIGFQMPDSPLSLNDVALEYEFKGYDNTTIVFKLEELLSLESSKEKFETNLLPGYKLLVPNCAFDTTCTAHNEPEFDFIKYPYYGEGMRDINKYLYKSLSVQTGLKACEDKRNFYITFDLEENGRVSDVQILYLNCTEKVQQELIKHFKKMIWTPASVKLKPVPSQLSFWLTNEFEKE